MKKDKLKTAILQLTIIQWLITFSKKIQLPGFESLSIYDLTIFIWTSFSKGNFYLRSAAVSFNFFTALFPSLIFILTLIPYIPVNNFQYIWDHFSIS